MGLSAIAARSRWVLVALLAAKSDETVGERGTQPAGVDRDHDDEHAERQQVWVPV